MHRVVSSAEIEVSQLLSAPSRSGQWNLHPKVMRTNGGSEDMHSSLFELLGPAMI